LRSAHSGIVPGIDVRPAKTRRPALSLDFSQEQDMNAPSRSFSFVLFLALSSLLVLPVALGQSLDPRSPAPMQPGNNSGTVDNFVGSNYFYLTGGPGAVTIVVSYNSMSLLGNAQRSALNIELSDDKKTWTERRRITSERQSSSTTLTGNLKVPTRLILSVIPPSGGLVRMGGDYTVNATGAVKFDPPLNPTQLIVGTYTPMSIHDNEDSAVKFAANGSLEFASGAAGRWKLFDAGSRLYTVSFAQTRLSLKLIPGRGLVDAHDPTAIVFQRTH
jgi:hypothetical protein